MMGGNKDLNSLSPCQWAIMYEFLTTTCYAVEGTSTCVESNTPKHITQDETWDTERLMNRTVIIHEGVTLTITCKVSFTPFGSIRVRNGGTLIVDEGHLTKLCDDYWRGIVINNVSGNAAPGRVITRNDAVIEYARLGIDARRDGIVHCTDTELRNNRKGAAFLNNKEARNAFFVNCEFYSDDDCGGDDCGHVGVSMWENREIYFSGCSFYDLMKYGILSIDANYYVLNGCQFKSIPDGIYAAGSYPTVHPVNVGVVIFGEGTPPPTPLPISSNTPNTFEGCVTAVNTAGVQALHVRGNDFKCNDTGVSVLGDSWYWIHDNDFNNHQSYDVEVMGTSDRGLNRIWCNRHPLVLGSGIRVEGNNEALSIDFNEFSETEYDIEMVSSVTNPASIRSPQGTPDLRASNKFSDKELEIYSPVGNGTIQFLYYPPNNTNYIAECDISLQNGCLVRNNFTNFFPEGDEEDCKDQPRIFGRPSTCNDVICFFDLNQQLITIHQNYDPTNPELVERDSLSQIRLFLRDSLTQAFMEEDENYPFIENMLLESGFHEDLMLLGKVQVLMEKFGEAEFLINSLTSEDSITQEYLTIHELNIQELTQDSLSEEAVISLRQMAANHTVNSGYAVRVLNRNEERIYHEEPIIEGPSTGCEIRYRNAQTEENEKHSENMTDELVSVYPNPSQDMFTVRLNNIAINEILLFNMNGQQLKRIREVDQDKIKIDSKDFASGVYILKLIKHDGSSLSKKILIQK